MMNKLFATTAVLAALIAPAHADTLWDHNGSLMHLANGGPGVSMIYDRVRPGLIQTIHPGDASFSGQIIGNQVVGDAFVYTKYCPGVAFPYRISGTYYGNTIEIRGAAPVVDPNSCSIIEFTWNSGNAHRVYTLISGPPVVVAPAIVPVPVPIAPSNNNNNNNNIVVPPGQTIINNNVVVRPQIVVPSPPIGAPPIVEELPPVIPPVEVPPPNGQGPAQLGQKAQREELLRQGFEFCRRYPTDKVCKGTKL